MKTQYCLGFLFSGEGPYPQVALIKKNRPEWQAGKLNGIGGKVEEGEHPRGAMRREFLEEAGVDFNNWTEFARMIFKDCEVFCYTAIDNERLIDVCSKTDEEVGVYAAFDHYNRLPNLAWLIPMAFSRLSEVKQGIIFLEHT